MVTLVIIFNHKYEKNLPLLRKMYKDRFSCIRFLMPFYDNGTGGQDPDVISVFENSHQFQGFIYQAYRELNQIDCSHYVFIGDDLILAPDVNEENILQKLHLEKNDAYIESLTPLKYTSYWEYWRFSGANKAFQGKSVNYQSEIPSQDFADARAREYGFSDYAIQGKVKHMFHGLKHPRLTIADFMDSHLYPLNITYPLVTAYSDFFVLPADKLYEYARLSGVFAAMRLFVEIAIPTALMLVMKPENLKMQKDVDVLTPKFWIVNDTATTFERQCDFKIPNMKLFWPENHLYLHPIKLSKWEE